MARRGELLESVLGRHFPAGGINQRNTSRWSFCLLQNGVCPRRLFGGGWGEEKGEGGCGLGEGVALEAGVVVRMLVGDGGGYLAEGGW